MIKHKHPESEASGSGRINIGDTERMISAIGGVILMASAVRTGTRRPAAAIGSALGALYLLFRSSTGHCHINEAIGRNTAEDNNHNALLISETIIVNRPKAQVYQFWRKLENLPRFMSHLKSVKEINETESHWEASVPGGLGSIKWDAEIIDDRNDRMISWKSKPGALVDNAGEVTFRTVGDRTEVHAVISYTPPAGHLGHLAAKWMNSSFESIIRSDLRNFRHMLETTSLTEKTA